MSRVYPSLPTAVPDGVPAAIQVRRPVRAEEETQVAVAARHLVGWRTLRRVPLRVDRHPADLGSDPDGSAETHVIGPWRAGPFATHVAVYLTLEPADDDASADPAVELTLQTWDGMGWVDVDAPDGSGGGPGVALDEDDLAGGVEGGVERFDLAALDETPTAWPTGARALEYMGVAAGDLLRVVVDTISARLWAAQALELRT